MKTLWILWILFSLLFYIHAQDSQISWINHLTRYISQETNSYQVMLIYQNNPLNLYKKNANNKIEILLREIGRQIPFIQTLKNGNLTQSNCWLLKQLPSFKNPRATSTIIIINTINNLLENQYFNPKNFPMDLIKQLSGTRTRPKCLLLKATNNRTKYQEFFKKMWAQQFLDLSILELVEEDISMNIFPNYKQDPTPSLHYFNPFTSTYTEEQISSKTNWFPEKLNNLQGYELKVGVYHIPPYVSLSRNLSRYPIISSMKGTNVPLSLLLAEVMNFKFIGTPSQVEDYGQQDCDKEKMTGLVHKLSHHQINYMVNQVGTYSSCNPHVLEQTKPTGFWQYCIVVPILFVNTFTLGITRSFLFAGILTILIVILILGISRLLKFNRQTWHLLNIFQLILGASIPRDPKKLQERILFGLILFACMIYVSILYALLTDFSLKTKSELKFSTLDDLADSGLVLGLSPYRRQQLGNSENKAILKLLRESVIIGTEECVEMLKKFKNVSCIMTTEIGLLTIEDNRNYKGETIMKFVKQPVPFTWRSVPLEPNSPYVERFNRIIQIIIESGFLYKWDPFFKNTVEMGEKYRPVEDLDDSTGLSWRLLLVLVIGHLLAFLAFAVELAIKHFNI